MRTLLIAAVLLASSGCTQTSLQTLAASRPGEVHQAHVPVDAWRNEDSSVWIASGQAVVQGMLDMARLAPDDYLVDLGSGDGRIVIAAARRGVRAHGIDYDAGIVAYARQEAQAAGVQALASFAQGDIFQADFFDASVVTLFLMPELNLQLRPVLLQRLAPGTRILSNTFDMLDWEPDETAQFTHDCAVFCRVLKWIVPARVEGVWLLEGGDTLHLQQRYQYFSGGTGAHALTDGRLDGTQIEFTLRGNRYTGRVDGNTMQGVVVDARGGIHPWRAVRHAQQGLQNRHE